MEEPGKTDKNRQQNDLYDSGACEQCPSSWRVCGVSQKARDDACRAAQDAGLPLGKWLTQILEQLPTCASDISSISDAGRRQAQPPVDVPGASTNSVIGVHNISDSRNTGASCSKDPLQQKTALHFQANAKALQDLDDRLQSLFSFNAAMSSSASKDEKELPDCSGASGVLQKPDQRKFFDQAQDALLETLLPSLNLLSPPSEAHQFSGSASEKGHEPLLLTSLSNAEKAEENTEAAPEETHAPLSSSCHSQNTSALCPDNGAPQKEEVDLASALQEDIHLLRDHFKRADFDRNFKIVHEQLNRMTRQLVAVEPTVTELHLLHTRISDIEERLHQMPTQKDFHQHMTQLSQTVSLQLPEIRTCIGGAEQRMLLETQTLAKAQMKAMEDRLLPTLQKFLDFLEEQEGSASGDEDGAETFFRLPSASPSAEERRSYALTTALEKSVQEDSEEQEEALLERQTRSGLSPKRNTQELRSLQNDLQNLISFLNQKTHAAPKPPEEAVFGAQASSYDGQSPGKDTDQSHTFQEWKRKAGLLAAARKRSSNAASPFSPLEEAPERMVYEPYIEDQAPYLGGAWGEGSTSSTSLPLLRRFLHWLQSFFITTSPPRFSGYGDVPLEPYPEKPRAPFSQSPASVAPEMTQQEALRYALRESVKKRA